jgi:predicted ATPase
LGLWWRGRAGRLADVIASVAFRNFKALRQTGLKLAPFNLVLGPNGSGKTSLIQAILRLRTLARLPLAEDEREEESRPGAAEITFQFTPPFDGLQAEMRCTSDLSCDLLRVVPQVAGDGQEDWPRLGAALGLTRAYVLEHAAIAAAVGATTAGPLAGDGGNLAAVLARWEQHHDDTWQEFTEEVLRLLPEYDAVGARSVEGGRVQVALRLAEGGEWLLGADLSQGTLYLLALLALAHDPAPPPIVCIEELDRGIHPRLLRDVRDALYRLSYPAECGRSGRPPVQVIATTHSPYLLDLFRDHPEEVIIADKHGVAATFTRLVDRRDLAELLAEGALGDMWFAGVLGGVPDER